MFHTRINRVQCLLLVVFLPLTTVTWLFHLSPFVSSAPSTPKTSDMDVIVSEIAWMGTTGSINDEWLELANNTAGDIDLAGWRLVASDGLEGANEKNDPVTSSRNTPKCYDFYTFSRNFRVRI